jgi:hypothetical protein
MGAIGTLEFPMGTKGSAGSKLFEGFVGWGGWGGSMQIVNPSRGCVVTYAMNAMGNHIIGGPRTDRTMAAIRKVIG